MRAPPVAQALNTMAADISTRLATLNPAQRQTLQLCAQGFSQQEAAVMLNCSPCAIKDRLIRVRRLLDASTTSEAVAMLYRAENMRLRAAAVEAHHALQSYQTGQALAALQQGLADVAH